MATVGILGAGQLGRMLALAGYPLGLHFRFFDPAPDATAGQLADHVAASYKDESALRRFADGLDCVTYEFENVPVQAARLLQQLVPVFPPPQALETAQDRLAEKNLFRELDIPTPHFLPIGSLVELESAVTVLGLPAVLKTRRLGYDGKGQVRLRQPSEIESAWQKLASSDLILEAFVPFQRELSILAVRGRDGTILFYPLVENVHRDGILRLSRAPAPQDDPELQLRAEAYARLLMEHLDYIGVLAVELFEVDGELLANEIAPRVHNSGHWTIEGAATSQFSNHLRAVLGWPLGSTAVPGQSVMVNLVGELPDPAAILQVSGAHLHLYDKTPRSGRKLGHITASAADSAGLFEILANLNRFTKLPELENLLFGTWDGRMVK